MIQFMFKQLKDIITNNLSLYDKFYMLHPALWSKPKQNKTTKNKQKKTLKTSENSGCKSSNKYTLTDSMQNYILARVDKGLDHLCLVSQRALSNTSLTCRYCDYRRRSG